MFDEIKEFFNRLTLNDEKDIVYNGESDDLIKMQDVINNLCLAKRLPVYNMQGEMIGYIDGSEYNIIVLNANN